MPHASDHLARLFYDDSCGPCTFFARASEAVSGQRLVATPLAAPAAEPDLGHLETGQRYDYAHLATAGELRSGEAILAPLVGLALGPRWERLVRRLPPLERVLRWGYLRAWEYRRTRGCAAEPRA